MAREIGEPQGQFDHAGGRHHAVTVSKADESLVYFQCGHQVLKYRITLVDGSQGTEGSQDMGVYEDLGVRTIINAWGNATLTGGSIMRPEVLASMEEASRSYVWLTRSCWRRRERRVAELAGVEAAYITSGAAAGIAISVAACMAGTDHDKDAPAPRHHVV